jgi:hypothetical protein
MISKMVLNLQELSIENNNDITDQGLIDFSKKCSTLSILNIQYCSNITDIGIIKITKILKYLNSFHFGNDNITEQSLIAMSKNCLNLWDCSKITDIGFNGLLTTTLKNLTELYFVFCKNLNDPNVIEMPKYFLNFYKFLVLITITTI